MYTTAATTAIPKGSLIAAPIFGSAPLDGGDGEGAFEMPEVGADDESIEGELSVGEDVSTDSRVIFSSDRGMVFTICLAPNVSKSPVPQHSVLPDRQQYVVSEQLDMTIPPI